MISTSSLLVTPSFSRDGEEKGPGFARRNLFNPKKRKESELCSPLSPNPKERKRHKKEATNEVISDPYLTFYHSIVEVPIPQSDEEEEESDLDLDFLDQLVLWKDSCPKVEEFEEVKKDEKEINIEMNKAESTRDADAPVDRPRIILRLQRVLPSNPAPHFDLGNDLKAGRMANSYTNIRAELLINDGGYLPSIVAGGELSECGGEAISRTLGIDQKHVRTLVNIRNSAVDKKKKVGIVDLDAEYDALLLRQIPNLAIRRKQRQEEKAQMDEEKKNKIGGESREKVGESLDGDGFVLFENNPENGSKFIQVIEDKEKKNQNEEEIRKKRKIMMEEKSDNGESNKNEDRVTIRVEEKGIIYLRLQEREFLVHRTSIRIPRMSLEEIEEITGKPHPNLEEGVEYMDDSFD